MLHFFRILGSREEVGAIRIVAMVLCAVLWGTTVFAGDADRGAFQTAFTNMEEGEPLAFIASVNRSLAKSDKPPTERRIRTIARVNRDAVRGSKDLARKQMLAEVFATAPFCALPAITDLFANDIVNRKFHLSDSAFTEFAAASLMFICRRLEESDVEHPDTRAVFAVTMYLKAAGERLASELRQPFLVFVPPSVRVPAQTDWIPAALGEIKGLAPSYQPLLKSKGNAK